LEVVNNKNFNAQTYTGSNQSSESNEFRKLSINNNNNGDFLAKNTSNFPSIASQRQSNVTLDDEDMQMASINLNTINKYPLNKSNSLQSNINYNTNNNINNNQINNNANNFNTLNNVQSNSINKSKHYFFIILINQN
jgi:hypothetical protein